MWLLQTVWQNVSHIFKQQQKRRYRFSSNKDIVQPERLQQVCSGYKSSRSGSYYKEETAGCHFDKSYSRIHFGLLAHYCLYSGTCDLGRNYCLVSGKPPRGIYLTSFYCWMTSMPIWPNLHCFVFWSPFFKKFSYSLRNSTQMRFVFNLLHTS